MKFMNEWEVEQMVRRRAGAHPYSPSLHRGALLLQSFMEAVNGMSDGWAHWPAAPRAAAKLMEFLELPPADEADRQQMLRSAERPLKSLCSRHAGLNKDAIWSRITEVS